MDRTQRWGLGGEVEKRMWKNQSIDEISWPPSWLFHPMGYLVESVWEYLPEGRKCSPPIGLE